MSNSWRVLLVAENIKLPKVFINKHTQGVYSTVDTHWMLIVPKIFFLSLQKWDVNCKDDVLINVSKALTNILSVLFTFVYTSPLA